MNLSLLLLICAAYGVHTNPLEGQDPESQYRLKVKVVHVTNPEEFLRGGGQVKLGLRLHGPFVYNVKITKTKVAANPNGTATFETKKSYDFNPQESIAKEDQALFTVPNVPYFNLVNSNEDPKLIEDLVRESNSSPFVLKTVQELLWGYEDPLLQLMSEKGLRKGSTFGIFAEDEEVQGMTLTVSSSSKMQSGHYDTIDVYNGNTRFNTWGNALCDQIKGTDLLDSDVRIHPLEKGFGYDSFFYLSSRFCRPLKFSYKANETDSEGTIQYLRYKPDDEFFGSVKNYPENKCFCSATDDCPLLGTADISKCKPGLVLSRPYFKLADETIRKQFSSGFEAHDDNEDILELEAGTGKISTFQLTLQWNVQMKKVQALNHTVNFTSVLLPMLHSSDFIQTSPSSNQGNEEEYQVIDDDAPQAMELAAPDGAKKVVKKIIEKKIEKKLLGKKRKHKSSASTFNNQWTIIVAILSALTTSQLLL
ncbi:unnamed protein product [Allacma fusca]|uniref:Uncharacterized protein n=1 Tax=Allacma fusca TaxID=39272 RepID=A0A8J2JCC8_9HEXA|nr:unnamed protein product [Allacma fusca]